jgi:large subunit ribosomal protein L1
MNQKIIDAIKKLREASKKRNFIQSFDLIISLREFDVKKPENKINEEFPLPHGRGDVEIVVFSDKIKGLDCKVLTSSDVEKLAKDRRTTKKLANSTDFFLAEAKMMPLIGKHLGQILAPRQKMPKIITGDVRAIIQDLKKSVRIKIGDVPVIQCIVGKESMKDEEIAENVESLIKRLEVKLPKGRKNIGRVVLKLTMGKPVIVEV